MPLLAFALTRSASLTGLVGFVSGLPYLVLQIPAGYIVDRHDRKRVMIGCDIIRCVLVAIIPLAIWGGWLNIIILIAIATANSCAGVFFSIAENALIPRVVSRSQLTSAVTQNAIRTRIASLLGPMIGGLLFQLRESLPFIATAVGLLGSVLTLPFVRTRGESKLIQNSEGAIREIVTALKWLWGRRFLKVTLVLTAASNFVFEGAYLVVIVESKYLGASSGQIGLAMTIAGLGAVVGSAVLPFLQPRMSSRALLLLASSAWLFVLPGFILVRSPYWFGVLFGIMSGTGGLWNVLSVYQMVHTPEEFRGRIGSIAMLMASGTAPLGSLVVGFLLGAGTTVAVGALLSIVVAIALCIFLDPSIRSNPQIREPAS